MGFSKVTWGLWHWAGEKLSESTAADVRQLCSTLLNCYLIQLLETGLLHADPHPGDHLLSRLSLKALGAL